LGHARLAIIDIQGGQQPMRSADSRMTIVFNGEIYNYRDLRSELESLGHVFRTNSDTEVLLSAYRQWGSESLIRLNGMFAFAVFDEQYRKLFLARDRTGIKPLYYYAGPKGIVFGSELKALFHWPETPRRANFEALTDFLMLTYPLPPATCFRDCYEVEPGSFLEISETGTRKGTYWKWSRRPDLANETDSLESLEHELRAAVREHLVSDVPVGAFLSGGIDSSLMVALMAANGATTIQTFNVKFGETEYDESIYARAVAARVGTEHHQLNIEKSGSDFSTVEKILDQFDQPFGDSSAIPTYLICREIRNHVKVVISGDGGDEMFGGYPYFVHADASRLLNHVPKWLLRSFEGALLRVSAFPPDARRQALRLVRSAQEIGQRRLVSICSLVSAQELLHAVQPEFAKAVGDYRPSFPSVNGTQSPGGAELTDVTINTALPGDYLRKVDVMSSAHGLEVRVPMLSNRVLDFASKVPQDQKYSWRQNKILLRRLARKYLPAAVASKKKQGFGIPLDSWLGDKGREALSSAVLDSSSTIRQLIRPRYIENVMSCFVSQKWEHQQLSRYSLYQRAYALWSLERWLDRWRPAI
jgi:asparagine synthase (glutamine-hydrolysing)